MSRIRKSTTIRLIVIATVAVGVINLLLVSQVDIAVPDATVDTSSPTSHEIETTMTNCVLTANLFNTDTDRILSHTTCGTGERSMLNVNDLQSPQHLGPFPPKLLLTNHSHQFDRILRTLTLNNQSKNEVIKHYYGLDIPIDKQQALLAGVPRKIKGYLTIGIPTVHRHEDSYLNTTLDSLLNNTSQTDRSIITIVIFIADLDDKIKQRQLQQIKHRYSYYISSGLIQVIGAPREFYPNFNTLKRTINDTFARVRWRSKQNYDFAFLMTYCSDISDYYIQLEDDIIAAPGYVRSIKYFIAKQKTRWACLQFSTLGYIGKLYHSSDVDRLAKMLILFFEMKPPDLLAATFSYLMMQGKDIVRWPSLFQHIGFYSSLLGKRQTLKDTYFPNKQFPNKQYLHNVSRINKSHVNHSRHGSNYFGAM